MEPQVSRNGRKAVNLPPDMEDDRLLSLAEAAKYLNCSIDTLRRQYQLGRIPPPVMIGLKKKAYSKNTLRLIARGR